MSDDSAPDSNALATIDVEQLLHVYRWRLLPLSLGLLLGSLFALAASELQTPIYQAQTQVMITNPPASIQATDMAQPLDIQENAATYVEWLSQDWMREEVARRVGGDIAESQVQILAATGVQIIDITVDDPTSARARSIADMLAQVLIEQSEQLQSNRYASAEESLNLQITNIKNKIKDTQTQLDRAQDEALKMQTEDALNNIHTTETNIELTQAEIKYLNQQGASDERQLVAAGTLETAIAEKQDSLNIQQSLLISYQATYANLVATENIRGTTDEITNLDFDLSLYQQVYQNLVNDRETMDLHRLQNSPDVVQLNPAFASTEPVRPRVLLNTLIGGLAGLMIVMFVVLVMKSPETTTNEANFPNGWKKCKPKD